MNMLLGLLVVVLFLCFFIKDYRKGIILTATTIQFLAYLGIGIPGVKISTFLMLFSVLLFFFKKVLRLINPRLVSFQGETDYPKSFVFISCFFILSFLVSDYYAEDKQTSILIINIVTMFIFPYVLWKVLVSAEYIAFAIKCLVILLFITLAVSIPEILFRKNYFTTFVENNFMIEDFMIDAKTVRFGLKRLNSIFSYFSVLGTISCFSLFLLFNIKYRYQCIYERYSTPINIFCIITPFFAFASGSRAIFLGLFAILMLCFCERKFWRHKSFKKLTLIFIVVSPIVLYIAAMVVDSIINSDTSQYAKGSSSDMRMEQFLICLPYFLESPIWGNGRLYIWNTVAVENPNILGAESIWFSILVDYGIVGGVAFLLLLILTGITLYKIKKSFALIPISYFLITLVSPDVGIQYNIYLTFVILLIKCHMFSDKSYEGYIGDSREHN